MSEISEKAFRKLRTEWFDYKLFSYSPEREWEDEEQSSNLETIMRVLHNKELRKKFNKQTEEILQGIDRCIAPKNTRDMLIGIKYE